MAWEALNNIAAGEGPQPRHRRQRQRPLLRPDDRRRGRPAGVPAAAARLRARCWSRASRRLDRTPVVGRPAVRGAARAEGGREGRARPAGAVLRPRHQVLRAGRRPQCRRGGVRAAPGAGLRRPGDRARRHPEGARLPARRERRGRADAQPRRRSTRSPACRRARRASAGQRLRRRARQDRRGAARTSSRSRRRCCGPTGLAPFAEAFPERCIDVGIAEQHALTCAAGLAYAGLHPVVAVYSTFLNRAFDQLLLDVALHRQAVTLVLDRAGVTGNDGPSHNGMWDLSLLGIVPGHAGGRAARRRDVARGARRGRRVDDGPTADPVPQGRASIDVGARRPAGRRASTSCARAPARRDVLLVCVGAFGQLGVAAAARLARQGVAVTVVDPRWVLPVPAGVVAMAREHRLVVAARATAVGTAASAPRWPTPCAPRSATCRCATSRSRRSSSSTAAGPTCWPLPGSASRTWRGGSRSGRWRCCPNERLEESR